MELLGFFGMRTQEPVLGNTQNDPKHPNFFLAFSQLRYGTTFAYAKVAPPLWVNLWRWGGTEKIR